MKFANTMLIFSLLIVGIYGIATDPELPTVRPVTDIPTADISKHKTTTPIPTTPTPKISSTTAQTSPIPTTTSAPLTTTTTTMASTTTTTTIQPSTTPKPTPSPAEPEARNWTLTDGNRTCILVELATQLNITYITNGNKTKYFVYNIPKDSESNVTGSCGKVNVTDDQFILIHWSDNNAVDNTLHMTFKLNHTTNEFSLNRFAFNLDNALFPIDSNLSSHSYYHVGSFFDTPKQNSYHCTRPQLLNLTNSENSTDVVGTVSFSHTLLEAYHEGNNKQFSTSIDCDAISTPDIVPIAVGIALIALVIIVLIAYVIGRRRSQAHGYVSM